MSHNLWSGCRRDVWFVACCYFINPHSKRLAYRFLRHKTSYMTYFVKWSILDRSTTNLLHTCIGFHRGHNIQLCSNSGDNVDVMTVLWLFYGRFMTPLWVNENFWDYKHLISQKLDYIQIIFSYIQASLSCHMLSMTCASECTWARVSTCECKWVRASACECEWIHVSAHNYGRVHMNARVRACEWVWVSAGKCECMWVQGECECMWIQGEYECMWVCACVRVWTSDCTDAG